MSHNAINSLYGHANREQTVLTPEWLVDLVREEFCGRIGLDPCYAEGCYTDPESSCTWPLQDGLASDWTDRTYVNPPYNNLQPWLERASSSKGRTIVLCPVRPHRSWWMHAFYKACEVMVMRPFPFAGHKQVFPAPLCLMYFNGRFRGGWVGRATGMLK